MKASDTIDLGPPPYPTDREREFALQLGRETASATNQAARLSAFARVLAQYRAELEQRGDRAAAYARVESEIREQRVERIRFNDNGSVRVERGLGETSEWSLLAAVDALGVTKEKG